ncbi:helix-turn-helix domain-containing protein [Pseudomonas sp. LB3P25]
MANLARAYCLPNAEHSDKQNDAGEVGGLALWRQRLAKQMIVDNLSSDLTVARLAVACVMSRSHFSRAFKRSMGFSPQDWINRQRISQAKQMIVDSDMTLTQISAECGFCDQAHFCRSFLKVEGINPRAWRVGVLASGDRLGDR